MARRPSFELVIGGQMAEEREVREVHVAQVTHTAFTATNG
jgi:hypothetical protein